MSGQEFKIDELRAQLKSLGYLDAGVDRFVLGPAREARRPSTIAALASLRVGLLAALLLGPAAAIGVGARVPGLVTGARDAIVIALYLGVVFGAAVTLITFAASVVLATASAAYVGRRARAVSIAGGVIVTIVCLAYLTLWWRMANPGPVWTSPVWTGVALAVAVTISLLLGHAVSVMARAVIMARHHSADLSALRASRQPYWKISLGAGALAFAGAATLLVVTARDESGRREAPPLTVVSSGMRVRVIAVDGFDPRVFESLSAVGGTPTLTAALSGARAHLAPEDTTDPARTWTTIATAQPPDVHRVHGLETRRVAGLQGALPSSSGGVIHAATDLVRLTRPSVASGEERRAKTMWEVAAESGLRTVVVNWWATWPAPVHSTATILTDRAVLRLERGGPLDAEIAPVDLYDKLRSRWSEIRRRAAERAAALTVTGEPQIAAVMRRSAELDALQLGLSEDVRPPEPDLLAVYLPGLDIAQHTLLGGAAGALPASAIAARVDALRAYYRFLDSLLRDVLAARDADLVVFVTAPGRVSTPASGVLALTGRAVRAGARIDARIADVMPTILYALGVPHSRELAGRPLIDLFAEKHAATYPIREVATYGPPSGSTAPRSGQPLDAEMLERLRSLGYVR